MTIRTRMEQFGAKWKKAAKKQGRELALPVLIANQKASAAVLGPWCHSTRYRDFIDFGLF